MAILMISYDRDGLVSESFSDGYIMIRVSDIDETQLALIIKVLANDRIEDLGFAFLNPDKSLDLRAGYADWNK
jgi:hypothetical protein